MARQPLPVSTCLAALLRERRQQMKLTLRDVEDRSRDYGAPIPFTTLGKVERGIVDPGLLRLNSLCKIYGISLRLAGDILDLEGGGLAVDQRSASALIDEAADAWKQGDLRRAVSGLAALRMRKDLPAEERQRALLHFSILAGSLGRYQLAQSIVEELLLEPPVPELIVRVLVQAAVCWHRRGCGDAALGFLARAEQKVDPEDHASLAYITHERASTLATMGQLDQAEKELTRATSAYRKAGNLYGEGGAQGVGIRIEMLRGNHPLAVELSRESLEHARRHNLERLICLRQIDLAKAQSELGRFDDAHRSLDEALAIALLKQDHPAQFFAYHARWRARNAKGDFQRARLELGAAEYTMRYVDEACPEAVEIRDALVAARSAS